MSRIERSLKKADKPSFSVRWRFLLKDFGQPSRNLLLHQKPARCLEDTGLLVYTPVPNTAGVVTGTLSFPYPSCHNPPSVLLFL
jgi:hypothetical protein